LGLLVVWELGGVILFARLGVAEANGVTALPGKEKSGKK